MAREGFLSPRSRVELDSLVGPQDTKGKTCEWQVWADDGILIALISKDARTQKWGVISRSW